jgi:hypothetical protein
VRDQKKKRKEMNEREDEQYGVPLLDKVYQLKSKYLTDTKSGCALLQFVEQELQQIDKDDENVYYVNPAAGYIPPTGEATKERAKLRVARQQLQLQHEKSKIKHRKTTRPLTVNERTKKAFSYAISCRYNALLRSSNNNNASEANQLIKAIDSAKGMGGSDTNQQETSNEKNRSFSTGMKPMNYETSMGSSFLISNNPNNSLVSFQKMTNEIGERSKKKNSVPSIQKKAVNKGKKKTKKKPPSSSSSSSSSSFSPLLSLKTKKKNSNLKEKKKNTIDSRVKNKFDHTKYINAKIPKRPNNKNKCLTRENKRLMKEIEYNLQKDDDYVIHHHHIDLDKFNKELLGDGSHDTTMMNNIGGMFSTKKKVEKAKINRFVTLNVNRVLAATEAKNRVNQSRNAITSRYYGDESHTTSYPSVWGSE